MVGAVILEEIEVETIINGGTFPPYSMVQVQCKPELRSCLPATRWFHVPSYRRPLADSLGDLNRHE